MENMKRLTKVTAGLMSFALALNTAGSLPSARSSPAMTASAAQGYYADLPLYEYELKDYYVLSVEKDDDFNFIKISLVPKIEGSYSIWSWSYVMDFYFDGNYLTKDEYESSIDMISKLSTGTIVTLKITAREDYPILRLTEEERDYNFDSRGTYYIEEVTKVKAPDINYYGDINDDGTVDSFDLITYRKHINDPEKYPLEKDCFLNGDIDQNEVIDNDDLQLVSDFLMGKIDKFYGSPMIGSIRLDDQVDIRAEEGKVTDEAFAKAEMEFGIDILKKSFDPVNEDKNLLISPVSISSALAMTANGADGNTKAEMEKVLGNGMTLDQLNEYMAYYVQNLPDKDKEKLYIANSIWFRDEPTFKVFDEFLEQNKKYYNSEIYKTPFDKNTVKDINKWVSSNTKGMIPRLLNDNDLDTTDEKKMMMALINTLYFEAEWQKKYENSYDGDFTDLNGNKHAIKEMYSTEQEYFDLGDADAFKKPYANGDYSFVGILPRDKDIVEYVKDLDADKLMEDLKECEDPDTVELHVMIPKFKYDYSKGLKEILSDMGMAEAFDKKLADFSKINDLSVDGAEPLFIDEVLHKTKIEVTEKGTKAAAVTAVMMAAAAAMPVKRIVNIYLNKPFVYMIVDKNNVPVFIGAATELEEK